MKMLLDRTTNKAELESAISSAVGAGSNCARVLPSGRTRASVLTLDKLPSYLGHEAQIEFGSRVALGLAFTPLRVGEPIPKPPVTTGVIITPTATGGLNVEPTGTLNQKVEPMTLTPPGPVVVTGPAATPPPSVKSKFKAPRKPRRKDGKVDRRAGNGYMAYIDQLLLDIAPGTVEGFRRSKYSVDEAVQKIVAKWPGKNPASVKRVVKVRPRHLEKIKSQDTYTDKNPAPRWRWVGPGAGSGYMRRIDELLSGKGGKTYTTRDLAEIVSREFGKDLPTALKVVRMRTSQYKAKHGKPAQFIRKRDAGRNKSQRKADRAALIAKNKALRAKRSPKGKKK